MTAYQHAGVLMGLLMLLMLWAVCCGLIDMTRGPYAP